MDPLALAKFRGPANRCRSGTGLELLPHECRRCGHATPLLARFCGNCGLRLRVGGGTERARFNLAMRRGILLRQRGPHYYRLAVRCFRIAMNAYPGAPEPVLEIARTYARNGRPQRARRWYRFLLRQIPDDIEAYLEGSETFPRQDHFHRARWLAKALARRPEDAIIRARFDQHFARLAGWQHWWIEQVLWQTYHSSPLETVTRS